MIKLKTWLDSSSKWNTLVLEIVPNLHIDGAEIAQENIFFGVLQIVTLYDVREIRVKSA